MKQKIVKRLAAVLSAMICMMSITFTPAQAADITIAAYMNYGEGDVLFYTTAYQDWAAAYPSTGGRWPAYCIDHEKYGPWTGNSFYSGLTLSKQRQLGYVFRNGYPNRDWGLPGPEAQYLTQAVVFGIMGSHASMYELEERVHSPAWIYADVFGYSYVEDSWTRPGHFQYAESLYNSAVSNASSGDAAYCILFEPYNTTAALQRMAVPVPDMASLRIRKTSQVKAGCVTDNANYSLEGAVYGVYSDPSCSKRIGELTTGSSGMSGYMDVDPGTYYIKEISPSAGFKLNTEIKMVQVAAGDSKTVDVTEPVEGDPLALSIIKGSANGGDGRRLPGAEFTLTYTYPGKDGSDKSMELVYSSNENGVINLTDPAYLVGGDPCTDPSTGAIVFFAGHIRVLESKAPEGYIKDEEFELTADLTVDEDGNITLTYDTGSMTVENESILVINVPQIKIQTKAADDADGDQIATLGLLTMITDHVTITDAVIGESVHLSGYPVFRSDFTDREGNEYISGDPVPYNGDRSIDSITYTAEAEEEEKDLRFCIDTVRFNGAEIVFFADVSAGVASDSHHYTDDEDEFISVPELPEIGTTASDKDTGDHVGSVKEDAVIADEVELTGLIPGTVYTLEGTLVYREEFTDPSGVMHCAGDPVPCKQSSAGSMTFTAESEEMFITLYFTVDALELAGTDVVAFERLYNKGVLFAVHADLGDENQTVSYPDIFTELTGADGETHFLNASEEIILTDRVRYANLTAGEKYSIEGTLMNRETGEVITDDEKNHVTAGTGDFVPEGPDGEVEITFAFAPGNLEGVSVVAFETLFHEGTEVASHKDRNDEGQSVYFAGIETSLEGENGTNEAAAADAVTLTDSVKYRNLNVTHEYELSGWLTDRESGETLKDATGAEIRGRAGFSPEAPDGTVRVEFSFDATAFAGRSVTAFEELTDLTTGEVAAVHKVAGSPSQTVSFPDLKTTLSGSGGEKSIEAGRGEITLKDRVHFENLIPGREYTLTGTLMDKADGKPALDVNGEKITSKVRFIPESAGGDTEIIFTFRAVDLEGKSLVAFESLENSAGEIAVHADLNDAAQTVSFFRPAKPRTGDTAGTVLWITLAGTSVIVLAVLIMTGKKRASRKK